MRITAAIILKIVAMTDAPSRIPVDIRSVMEVDLNVNLNIDQALTIMFVYVINGPAVC